MKFFKRTDILVITAIIAVAAAIWFFYSSTVSGKPVRAEIYYYSQLVKIVELTDGQEKEFIVPQAESVILRMDGEGNIQFIESDCPDKVCIKTGKIHLAGQSAACLPNGVIVKLIPAGGWNGDEPDIVIGVMDEREN